MSVLEDVFRSMLIKMYGSDDNYDIIINIDKGDFEIWRNREVVEDGHVEDSNRQIALSEAQKIDEDYTVGKRLPTRLRSIDFGEEPYLPFAKILPQNIGIREKQSLHQV